MTKFTESNKLKEFVIAVVGMPGAGKSIATQHLSSLGYKTVRFGKIIVDEVQKRGLEVNEYNERIVREDLRRSFGMDFCAKLSLPKIEEYLLGENEVAIDGLYSLSEYESLISRLGNKLVVIAIFTPKSIRYRRLMQRKERPLTPDEAKERDFSEIKKIEKAGPIALADFTIINDGSPEQLCDNLDKILSELGNSYEAG